MARAGFAAVQSLRSGQRLIIPTEPVIAVPEIELSSLQINGFGGAPLPNRFLRLKGALAASPGDYFPWLALFL